ncbi:S-layer homology domain-containing protein [Cohnella caldifontis]|uniref:S-layer homology domain-containing protein n=1 Tax=Cohnella caldifontis TaxID=3027471 RepID=UPI0023EC1362|nr:S-layer homology domain-containing protein [Cohnella sp. YIM B05605]
MKNVWKKTAVTALAVSMLAGSAAGVASAKSNHGNNGNGKGNGGAKANVHINLNFKDLNEKQMQWAYAHIIRLAAQGVFNGYDDGSFKPGNNISRVETIVAAVRLLGLEAEAQKPENMNATLNFKDFDQLKKKYPNAVGYVAVALKNDLIGEDETSIQPEKPATRLWASVLLVKGLKLGDEARADMTASLPFKDSKEIPAGSVGYVAVAVEKGIVSGYTDQTFKPNKPVTRAELATILDRLGVELPGQGNTDTVNAAVTGTVVANVYGSSITVQKTDGTNVTIPVASDVFVFRNGVKASASAIVAGDQVLVRTYNGQAVFIEVTKLASATTQFTDAGKVSAFTFDAQGRIATISLVRDVNGTSSTVVYNVDPSVSITGGSGVLAVNLVVIVKGENSSVKQIQITG